MVVSLKMQSTNTNHTMMHAVMKLLSDGLLDEVICLLVARQNNCLWPTLKQTRKRELVDTFFQRGLAVSYDQLKQVSTDFANVVIDWDICDWICCLYNTVKIRSLHNWESG